MKRYNANKIPLPGSPSIEQCAQYVLDQMKENGETISVLNFNKQSIAIHISNTAYEVANDWLHIYNHFCDR